MSAEIIAVSVKMGNKDIPGPAFAQLRIIAFEEVAGSPGAGIISPELASDREIDDAVAYIIKEAEKAGRAAKKILSDSKGVCK